jgi:geranylgeranyl diphosphate synthase type I
MPTDPAALDARLTRTVDETLARVLAARGEQLAQLGPEAAGLTGVLEDFLHGGKRLRPRICFWSGVACLDHRPDDREIELLGRYGAAIELVQAAALLHDDVIDRSDTRRGRPAVHVAAAARHRDEGLTGDGDRFGEAVAIVLGDLALSWAVDLADGSSSDEHHEARDEFARLRTEVMGGQFLDILHQAGGFTSQADAEAAALSVIRWKTVPYTVLRPARIGARLMGADTGRIEVLSRWAEAVGTAFQLRDDLLGVVGDPSATGKPTGGDLLEGKRTVVLARTRALVDAADARLLDEVVGNASATADQVRAVTEVMVRIGAIASVAGDIATLRTDALDALDAAGDLSPQGRDALRALTLDATDLAGLPGTGDAGR